VIPEPSSSRRSLRSSAPRMGGAVAAAFLSVLAGCALTPKQSDLARPAGLNDGQRPMMSVPPFSGASREDAIVRIVGPVACTGTLIAEDLVLTAHHCVTARDERGRSVAKNVDASDLHIELGGGQLPWAEVNVRAVLAPDCGYVSGEGDIAVLVLSRRLVGMSTMQVRLEAPPKLNELILATGFGKCWMNPGSVTRENRKSHKVDTVDAGLFAADAAICPGDSGGPVRRWEGDAPGDTVMGVVSSSVMDGDETTLGRSYFTRLDRWKPFFAAARAVADGASASEVPPFKSCSE